MSFIYHASVRLCSRYPGVKITVPYLKEQFEAGNFVRRLRTAPNRYKFWVCAPCETLVVAVYDTDINHVVTVLPPEELTTDVPVIPNMPHLSGPQLDYLMKTLD